MITRSPFCALSGNDARSSDDDQPVSGFGGAIGFPPNDMNPAPSSDVTHASVVPSSPVIVMCSHL
jgi:hypothetical protein